jgi:hypothetical protein
LKNYSTLFAYYVYDCYYNVTVPCTGTIKRAGEKFSNLQEINPATSRGRNPPTGWEDK